MKPLKSLTLRMFGVGRRTVVARLGGGGGRSRSSRAPTATAGSLSAAADGPPEADPMARRRRGSHRTLNNVTFHPLRCVARYFGSSTAPQTEPRSTPAHEVQRFRYSAVVLAHFPGILHFRSPKWQLKLLTVPGLTRNFDFSQPVSY